MGRLDRRTLEVLHVSNLPYILDSVIAIFSACYADRLLVQVGVLRASRCRLGEQV